MVQANLIHEDVVEEIYVAKLEVPSNFGEIGAVIVENFNQKEMFIKEVDLDGLTSGSLTIPCNSWVQPKTVDPTQRVFFTNKVVFNPFSFSFFFFFFCYLPNSNKKILFDVFHFWCGGYSHTCHRKLLPDLYP